MKKENKIASIFSKIKSKVGNNPEADLTPQEKKKLDEIIRERRLEIIAESKLKGLERKYGPKKKMSDLFNEIKSYRQGNLKKRGERISETERKKVAWNELERKRQLAKGELSGYGFGDRTIGDRIRNMEKERMKRRIK